MSSSIDQSESAAMSVVVDRESQQQPHAQAYTMNQAVRAAPDQSTTAAGQDTTTAARNARTADASSSLSVPSAPRISSAAWLSIKRSSSLRPDSLSSITEEKVRSYLDPNNTSVSYADLCLWSQADLDALLHAMKPSLYRGMIEKAQQAGIQGKAATLSWSRLSYTDDEGNKRLQDVSGYFQPGELVGLIAAPDAGATILLQLLASGGVGQGHRLHGGTLSGQILYDRVAPGVSYHKTVGFISQSDLHLPLLSVEETLFFSSRLRLPASISDSLIRLQVALVLKMLGLTEVKDSYIGDHMVKGISGGQKRRVSVGVELVAGHSVLLADLPTNGLDSATAYGLIRTFRHMVNANLSMLMTVVQAGPELFSLFHRIIVMSKGTVVYSGPPHMAEAYFHSIGFTRPSTKTIPQFLEELSAEPEAFYRGEKIHKHDSELLRKMVVEKFGIDESLLPEIEQQVQQQFKVEPLSKRDYSLYVYPPGVDGDKKTAEIEMTAPSTNRTSTTGTSTTATATTPPPSASSLNEPRVAAWKVLVKNYQQTLFYGDIRETLNKLDNKAADTTTSSSTTTTTGSAASWWRYWQNQYDSNVWLQFRENFLRHARIFIRSPSLWKHVWVSAIIMGFLLGSLFYQLDDSVENTRTRIGLYFYLLAYFSFNGFNLLPVILSQRSVFYAEVHNTHSYAAFTYYVSFILVQMSVVVVHILLVLIPVWGLSDLAGHPLTGGFWFGFFVILLVSQLGRNWIVFLLYLSPSAIVATTVITISFYLFALISGEFISTPLITTGWRWSFTVSYFNYGLKALVLNDPGDSATVGNLLGYDTSDSKWPPLVDLVWFWLTFSAAALFSMTFLNWDREDVSAVSDWHSPTSISYRRDREEDHYQSLVKMGTEQISRRTMSGGKICYLQFTNLNYTVTLPNGEQKQLLHDVFGYVRPGRLVALIGKSGAGKSTLLDVLSGQKTTGILTGEILVNGKPKDVSTFSRLAGYVEQFDSHNPLSTIEEALYFSGRLRLDSHLTNEEIWAKVDRVLGLLNLKALRHAIVGMPGAGGVSMEIRKKLTIGVELITEPAILFLDEPTTGLDSSSAANVMRAVRGLASSISVFCTLHQPPEELVQYFQDVLLLEEGGRVVFFGAVEDLPVFLGEQPGIAPIVPGRNVSDYALEAVSAYAQLTAANEVNKTGVAAPPLPSSTDLEAQDAEQPPVVVPQPSVTYRALYEAYLESRYYLPIKQQLAEGVTPPDVITEQESVKLNATKAGFLLQLSVLTRRFFYNNLRNISNLKVRYSFALFFGFAVGTVFYQEGLSQQTGPQHLSVVFFVVGHFLFSCFAFFLDVFLARPIYFRETVNHMYSALPYFVARFLGDQVHIFLEVLIPTLMVYFLAGLNPMNHSSHYGYFLWACWIMRITAMLLVQLLASVIAAPDFAFSVLSTTFYIMFALCGFFIPNGQIPDWWKWLSDLNFFKYLIQFLSISEYENQVFTCDPNTDTMVVINVNAINSGSCGNLPIETFPNPSDPSGATVLKCQYSCGFEFLDSFGVDHSVVWEIQSFVIVHCFTIFFFVAGYLALKYINHIRR